MTRKIGREVAERVLKDLRALTYDECKKLIGHVSTKLVKGSDGQNYQVEYETFWDDKKRKSIRMLVSASGDGFDQFVPSTADFIVAPDGSYIGENSK